MQQKEALWIVALSAGLLVLLGILAALLFSFRGAADSPGFFSGTVAIIPIDFEISNEAPSAFSAQPSAFDLVDLLDSAEKDASVKVILLQINSPGGSIVATKQVVEKVREVREKKPVVSWIGDLGASGAYYIAAASDYIVADADSLTGSIGVISILPNFSGLMEKIGVKVEVLKEGRFKDLANPFGEGLSPAEKALFQALLHQAFDSFKGDVLEFRGDKLDAKKFEQVADGRILSGSQALEAGLIDELGSRQQAIRIAGERGHLPGEPSVRFYSKETGSFLELFSQAGAFFGKGLQSSFSLPSSPIPEIRS